MDVNDDVHIHTMWSGTIDLQHNVVSCNDAPGPTTTTTVTVAAIMMRTIQHTIRPT